MNNLNTYQEYLNEGLFGSKYKNVVDKIYNYLTTIDLDRDVEFGFKFGERSFIIKKQDKQEYNPMDPYGEEECEEEDVVIELCKEFELDSWRDYNYFLYLNYEKVEVTNKEAKRLYKYVEDYINSRADRQRKEVDRQKKERIQNIINKLG
jgi:hypothetical protein